MPSQALQALGVGALEVGVILAVDPTPPGGLSPHPARTRAVTRAALVMLCGHFERYVRGSIEEAVEFLNSAGVHSDRLPTRFRLQHTREPMESLSDTQWYRREEQLGSFVKNEGWLWAAVPPSSLEGRRLLTSMNTPTPKKVIKVYRMWGVNDIFRRITRASHTRGRFRSRLGELVQKRNNIAHGDFTVDTTRGDMEEYLDVVEEFCRRADGVLAKILHSWTNVPSGW